MTEFFYIIAGGTMVHVRPHFSLSAPAYGAVGRAITRALEARFDGDDDRVVVPIFTRMAEPWSADVPVGKGNVARRRLAELAAIDERFVRPETNDDVARLVEFLVEEDCTRCIVMAAAICDWQPAKIEGEVVSFGKGAERLRSRAGNLTLELEAADKIIGGIRRDRKDIFLVSFKATAGVDVRETYRAGLESLKRSSSNLVFANDVQNHHNVVVTPEEYPYFAETRDEAIETLGELIDLRTRLDFVRTRVVEDSLADINALHEAKKLPANFVPVLRHLVERNAFKPFLGKTSGHFGCKVNGEPFERISSERKVDHNHVFERGMVKIYGFDEAGQVTAGATKPSVGEHTQAEIYGALPEASSIVHFHSPARPGAREALSNRSQRPYECGSVQCGLNTASGMRELAPGIWAVHLEGHGPNIAFARDVDAASVIETIETYWDLDEKSGGLVNVA